MSLAHLPGREAVTSAAKSHRSRDRGRTPEASPGEMLMCCPPPGHRGLLVTYCHLGQQLWLVPRLSRFMFLSGAPPSICTDGETESQRSRQSLSKATAGTRAVANGCSAPSGDITLDPHGAKAKGPGCCRQREREGMAGGRAVAIAVAEVRVS